MRENTVLNAISTSHPVKSSFAKLTKETGMARNEIKEVVTDLNKIGYISTTTANEIYLVADGRKFLGLDNDNSDAKPTASSSKLPNINSSIKEPVSLIEKGKVNSEQPTEEHGVLTSIDELAMKLNKPVIEITDCDLKGQALTRLADLMSDDIAELLLDIKADLERAAA